MPNDRSNRKLDSVEIGLMKPKEVDDIASLVRDTFWHCVASEFEKEGKEIFLTYAQAQELYQRSKQECWVLVARQQERPVGMIEVRDNRHISLFFVARDHQRHGIGRRLLTRAIKECWIHKPGQRVLDVHASSNAVAAYRSLGFRAVGTLRQENGMRYQPMQLTLYPNSFESEESHE